VEIGQKEMFLW